MKWQQLSSLIFHLPFFAFLCFVCLLTRINGYLEATKMFQLTIFIWTRYYEHNNFGIFFQKVGRASIVRCPGARFSIVPKTFRAGKAIRKTPTCIFYEACLFVCCKGINNKNNCKVSCLEKPSFWRYKEKHVTRNGPGRFRDFRETSLRPQLFKRWIVLSMDRFINFDSVCLLEINSLDSAVQPLNIWSQNQNSCCIIKMCLSVHVLSISCTAIPQATYLVVDQWEALWSLDPIWLAIVWRDQYAML